jgi:Plasmid pRiA4b ORF-3-like protein
MRSLAKVIPLFNSKAGGFELDVSLRGAKPAIWRRLRVASSLSLRELHHVLQIALGWDDKHLHQFDIEGKQYGMNVPGEKPIPDEREFQLWPLLRAVESFDYLYDFGDGWSHEVLVKPVPLTARSPKAECLDGDRAMPPEDCGGPHGYQEMLKALDKPKSPKGREILEWIGPDFDPAYFNLQAVNRELRTAGTKAFLRKRERFYEGN